MRPTRRNLLLTLPALAPARPRAIAAVAFDAFAIFDPRPVAAKLMQMLPGQAPNLAEQWRQKQFESTWLRTLSNQYADFWQVTRESLAYTLRSNNLVLSAPQQEELLDTYRVLPLWPDSASILAELHASGLELTFLSNMTESMLRANLRHNRLEKYFPKLLSTDLAAVFKPHPRAYNLAPTRLRLPKSSIVFVAFAAWDAAGASRFGFPTYWANRGQQAPEAWMESSVQIAPSLVLLPKFLHL
ncbi:MAG: haloacid dehalogenase type II [Bryobacter sp.]|nr:haloacid dehalogenase type II [Bryobacter sp.]